MSADPILDPTTVYPWAPSVDDVARVSQNYTEGGFDSEQDSEDGLGTFTDSTEPSYDEVQGLILSACDEVAGRAGVPVLPARCYTLAKTTAKWHAAAAIAGDKAPQGTDDAGGEYRSKILNYRNSLDELIAQARMAMGNRLH